MRHNTRAIDRPYRSFFIALNYWRCYMGRIDKLEFVKGTLIEIQEIYDKGFNKGMHPAMWQDLTRIMVRIKMLLKLLES